MKAKEWLDRGMKETDPVNAFSNFWRGFNNLFYGEAQGSEREKIRAFLSQKITEADAKGLLQEHEPEISYLLSKPVIDMRGNGRDTTEHIQAFNAANNSLDKLQEIFMIIYQVRCNLEHGQKSPTRERDIQLCQCAHPFVAKVISRTA